MQSLTRLTVFLCCLWAVTVLYGEMVAYWAPLRTCSWPRLRSSSADNAQYMKIAVLADPQLMDRTSHGFPPKSLALEAAQFYTDLYMRRSFHLSILPFTPDSIVFLGDYFDGGPILSDEEWQDSLNRFKHIFSLSEKDGDLPIYYLSGNHDIGYTGFHSRHPEVISRYQKEFGSRNYQFSAGKLNFVVVDAQTLDGHKEGKETSSSWEFIQNVHNDPSLNPKVLLTHIPLYRPDETPCGPHRSSPVINQRVSYSRRHHGISYQNYVSEETSTRLLDLIRPILILSGHDHDQCTVVHSSPSGPVTEHTVGTISWQQGNLHPSFMLLSVATSSSNSSSSEDLVSTELCFLPMQLHIYIWYLIQFFITLVLLITWPTNGFGLSEKCMSYIQTMKINFTTTTKEKDDEENCEYEMIWDAEGSMHIVKKATAKVPIPRLDVGLTGRSRVVSRPTAKRHSLELEASVLLETGTEPKWDDASKSQRPSKSRVRILIQRLFRLRLLVVVAAVNVPLYMMLLFKDWIDR